MRFARFDIGPLVDADLQAGRFANSALQALLIYRFWCKAGSRGVIVSRLVDWHEGHDVDHATAAAINWHSHSPDLVAFRPIVSPSYLSVTPTRHEISCGVVPLVWGVVGTLAQNEMRKAFPEISVLPAPGLRHRRFAKPHGAMKSDGRPVILVLASIESELARRLQAALAAAMDAPDSGGYIWWIKRHPGMPEREAEAIFGAPGSSVRYIEGDFYDWLKRADIVVGLGTNTLIEAIAFGTPTICVAGGNQPTEVPLSDVGTSAWWRIAYDPAEFASLLPEALGAARDGLRSSDLREELLGPFDPAVLRDLLFDDRRM